MGNMLQKELEVYEAHRAELLASSRDKFVLVKDAQIVGVFSSEDDAIKIGYEKFGNVPFLVKQVVEMETPIAILRLGRGLHEWLLPHPSTAPV